MTTKLTAKQQQQLIADRIGYTIITLAVLGGLAITGLLIYLIATKG